MVVQDGNYMLSSSDRVLMGLFEAASFPCITSMLARWERGLYPNLNLRE